MSPPSLCIYCKREYKTSDSRPYPNSKSKDRIHNKCHIKKNLIDKKLGPSHKLQSMESSTTAKITSNYDIPASSLSEQMAKEEENLRMKTNERQISKILKDEAKDSDKMRDSPGQFFFDVKAGVAKPHEKKQYLHHRNLTEIVARFDDNGFQEEAIGRSYDHTGKDLDTLGDSDDDINDDNDNGDNNDVDAKEELKKKADNHRSTRDQHVSCKRQPRYTDKTSTPTSIINKRPKINLDEQNPCWFCLSSAKVEKHLIIAIGDFCYLSLAKGGLVDEHLLLIPIEHLQSMNDSEANRDMFEEVNKFKSSLIKYFGKEGKGVAFFERNFRSVHWQLQVVPIPLEVLDDLEQNIKRISTKQFKNSNYIDIPISCSISDMIPPKAPYMYWQLEPLGSRFVTQIQTEGSFFPIQIGRLVLADPSILDCPDKVDWKKCEMTRDEYVNLAKTVKEKYKEYDFT